MFVHLGIDGSHCRYCGLPRRGPGLQRVAPVRLFDSRPGASTIDGIDAGSGLRPAGSTTDIAVSGRGAITAVSSAVVLNVTAVSPAADGYLAVWPCGRVAVRHTATQSVERELWSPSDCGQRGGRETWAKRPCVRLHFGSVAPDRRRRRIRHVATVNPNRFHPNHKQNNYIRRTFDNRKSSFDSSRDRSRSNAGHDDGRRIH